MTPKLFAREWKRSFGLSKRRFDPLDARFDLVVGIVGCD
jgi:hypothetical protein